MAVSDELQCVFTARLENKMETNSLEVPQSEIDLGNLEIGETYRVAVYPAETAETATTDAPVSKGERVTLEIHDIGEQGDGIGRYGPGYIVFVPDTAIGDEVTVEIKEVTENFAFGEKITAEE